MAMERVDIFFSPTDPKDRDLIEVISSMKNEYGARSRFLKERLLIGCAVISAELDGFLREKDPMEALDRYGVNVDARHYRVLKLLLKERLGVVASESVVAMPAVQQVQPIYQAVAQVKSNFINSPDMDVAPMVNAVAAQVLGRAGNYPVSHPVDDIQTPASTEPEVKISVPPQPIEHSGNAATESLIEPVAPASVRKHDWSGFAGIAGVKKGD